MMNKHCFYLSIIGLMCLFLTACISDIWSGASLIYDRHNVYIKVNDFQLGAKAHHVLFNNKICDKCTIEIAVFNRDILLAGSVPSPELRAEAYARMKTITDKRRLFKQIEVSDVPVDTLKDSLITTKIRSKIFADADINPHQFKVVTVGRIVYLMGDVIPEQAEKVILFARECPDVRRVVKLFKYYNLSSQPLKEKA